MNEENVSIMLNSSNAFLLRNVQSITGGLRTWDYDLCDGTIARRAVSLVYTHTLHIHKHCIHYKHIIARLSCRLRAQIV